MNIKCIGCSKDLGVIYGNLKKPFIGLCYECDSKSTADKFKQDIKEKLEIMKLYQSFQE